MTEGTVLDIRTQTLSNARCLWTMIERERALKRRDYRQREMPRDFNVVLTDAGWRSQAFIVYGGDSEDGGMGPLLLFVEGKATLMDRYAMISLLNTTMSRIEELKDGNVVRCAGTAFKPNKRYGGGTYE